jgi:hypothetical protein
VASQAVVSERAEASVLRCDNCGAAVRYEIATQAPRCAFCGAVTHIERPEDPLEEADFYVPFAVDPATAHAALRGWLGSLGFFRPPDLASQATLLSLKPLWWVAWLCDVEALISWTADSNFGTTRSEWAPHAGQNTLRVSSLLISASRGLTYAECAALAASFNLSMARPEPYGPPGAVIERFDVQRSAARQQISSAIDRSIEAQLKNGIIPGSRYRNLHVATLLSSLHTRRFALPSYVLAYYYRGRLYRALIHGQDARCAVGDAPYSLLRIALVAGVVGLGVILFVLLLTAL